MSNVALAKTGTARPNKTIARSIGPSYQTQSVDARCRSDSRKPWLALEDAPRSDLLSLLPPNFWQYSETIGRYGRTTSEEEPGAPVQHPNHGELDLSTTSRRRRGSWAILHSPEVQQRRVLRVGAWLKGGRRKRGSHAVSRRPDSPVLSPCSLDACGLFMLFIGRKQFVELPQLP
jgi:hypothetical protein